MENRSHGTGEELARTKEKLYGFPSSARAARNSPAETLIQPSIEIRFEPESDQFQPGDFLSCEYRVTQASETEILAVETSVIWLTEGKGDSDIGVHFFERRPKEALTNETFHQPQRMSTVLPASPLSYEGRILKIRWCVRVRLFLSAGEQFTQDRYFKLGRVEPFCPSALDQSELDPMDLESDDSAPDVPDNSAGTGTP